MDAFLGGMRGTAVMLKVFLDESGTHDASPVVTVAAAYARPTPWRKWTADWNRAKRPIRVYHASDAHNLRGEFKDWSREDRTELVKRILPTIPKHQIKSLISGIDVDGLREHTKHRPEVLRWFGAPYMACLHWIMPALCERALASGDQRVAFIHEENQYQKEALETHDWLKRRGAFNGIETTLTFAAKADFVPLQCADVLAYEAHRQMRAIEGPIRLPLSVIDPHQEMMFKGHDRNTVPEMADELIRCFDQFAAGGRTVLRRGQN